MKPAPPVTTARIGPYPRRAVFVTFEGIDGSGKSTQVGLLRQALEAEGRTVVTTREPGGTPLGEHLRSVLLDGPEMTAWAEAALFAAARAELVARVVQPALEAGHDVLCDRYVDSSLAYQGIARGLGVDRVLELNLEATRGLLPDRTFLLRLDPSEAARRRTRAADRIEAEADGFMARVDAAYRELAALFPRRIQTLDATLPPDELAEAILGRVRAAA
jgi:dTMP kinase